MAKVINKNLISEIEPVIKLRKDNKIAWEKIKKLASKINLLNKKRVSAIKILLRERKLR